MATTHAGTPGQRLCRAFSLPLKLTHYPCGKELDDEWAVAHYLAHLVQQKAAPTNEERAQAIHDEVRRLNRTPSPDKAILDELMRDAKPFIEPPVEPR